MENDRKMEENENNLKENETAPDEAEMSSRRNFLRGLGKWSKAVIGGIILGKLVSPTEAEAGGAAWVNRRGGWINGAVSGGGGAAWVNRAGGWINGGGGGSAGWVNRAGGGGAAWVNRRGY